MKEPSWMAGPDDDDNLSPQRDQLWALLENAKVPMYLIELVDRVVGNAENTPPDYSSCPACMERELKEGAALAAEAGE